ncbi:hypothetical protein, partial [uncultured Prevotella sp.]|uniref:hypothetical protein n=1 Tax=uncultured Prevotella sp. TaxID=159272 RepID=UPI0026718974
LAFPKGRNLLLRILSSAPPSLPRRITHPNLPKGKELVTQNIVISPHLASPVGEGQLLLLLIIY